MNKTCIHDIWICIFLLQLMIANRLQRSHIRWDILVILIKQISFTISHVSYYESLAKRKNYIYNVEFKTMNLYATYDKFWIINWIDFRHNMRFTICYKVIVITVVTCNPKQFLDIIKLMLFPRYQLQLDISIFAKSSRNYEMYCMNKNDKCIK